MVLPPRATLKKIGHGSTMILAYAMSDREENPLSTEGIGPAELTTETGRGILSILFL
jgi:hypothetical protein